MSSGDKRTKSAARGEAGFCAEGPTVGCGDGRRWWQRSAWPAGDILQAKERNRWEITAAPGGMQV
jgi:hypothetical protein